MARRCNLTEEEARSLDSVAGDLDFLLVVIPAGVALEVEDNNSAREDDTGGVRSLRAQFFILLVQSEHTLFFPEIGTHQEREASVKRSEEIKKKKERKEILLGP